MPVGSTARSPGASVMSTAVTMSAPASPGSAYAGIGTPGSMRCTSTVGRSSPPASTGHEATLVGVSPSTDGTDAGASDATPAASYRKTLRTPWWWYPIAVGIACLLAAEFHIAGLRLTDWIPFGTLIPLSILAVWWLGRTRIEISAGELRVR